MVIYNQHDFLHYKNNDRAYLQNKNNQMLLAMFATAVFFDRVLKDLHQVLSPL